MTQPHTANPLTERSLRAPVLWGIVFLAMKEPPLMVWYRFPLSYLPVALFLMPAVLHLTMLPQWPSPSEDCNGRTG